jgi:hypothetical protein
MAIEREIYTLGGISIMEQCIICKNETANNYTYYSGDFIGSKIVDIKHNYDGNVSSYTENTTYTNLQQHSEYLCSKHVINNNDFASLFYMLYGCIVLPPLFMIIFALQLTFGNPITDDDGGLSLFIGFGLITVLAILINILVRKFRAKKDKRCDEEGSAEKVISKVKKLNKKNKINENKHYFTPKNKPLFYLY